LSGCLICYEDYILNSSNLCFQCPNNQFFDELSNKCKTLCDEGFIGNRFTHRCALCPECQNPNISKVPTKQIYVFVIIPVTTNHSS